MRIQKIGNFGAPPLKRANITKPKMLFKADEFKKAESEKLTFAQKRAQLSKLKNIGIKNYYKALLLEEDEFWRFVDFYENEEEKSELALKYAKLGVVEDVLYTRLRINKVSPEYALKVTSYDSKQLDRYTKIYNNLYSDYTMDAAVRLEDKKFDRLTSLLNEGNSLYSAYDTASLEDEQYEKAMELKEKGFNLAFVDNVVKDEAILNIVNRAIEDGINIKTVNAAFKNILEFQSIKQNAKRKNLDDVLVETALKNTSGCIMGYFEDNIKNADWLGTCAFDSDCKVSVQVIDRGDEKIRYEYSYDKNGKIKEATCINSNNKSVKFSFENEGITSVTCENNEKKLDVDIKSPEFFSLFSTKFGTECVMDTILNAKSALYLHDGDYKDLSALLFGAKDEKLCKAQKEFEAEFPNIELLTDNNIDPKYITRLKNILKTQPQREISKKIILTSLMPKGVAGEFMHTDVIGVFPAQNIEFFDISVCHELQHLKDYTTGVKYGQKRAGAALIYDKNIFSDKDGQILKGKIELSGDKIFIKDCDLKCLIEKLVSRYAATESAEFIAEIGAMMRKGVVGAKIENDEIKYSINKKYKNTSLKDSTINKDEFAKLLKLYLLLGGTPEFNDNFIKSGEVITLTQKDVMEADL